MKKTLFFFLFILQVGAFAQSGTQSFTLQQAIDYALKNKSTIQNNKLDEDIASQKVKEITGIGLPQISASFEVQDFFELPTSLIPGEFFGGSPGSFIPVKFGTQYQATAGVTATQLLFEPSYLVGLQATKTYRELSVKQSNAGRIDVIAAVSKAYYSAIINRERLKLLEANVNRFGKLKDDTKAYYDNGLVEKLDFDRISLTFNQITIERDKVAKLVGVSEMLLKFQMGMSVTENILLTDSLNESEVKNYAAETKFDVSNRIEYSILKTQQHLLQLDLKKNKSSYIPSLVAYVSASASAQRNEFDIFDTKKGWYPTGILGGKLSWNLFDGTQREHKISQSKLTLKKIENTMADVTNAFTLETESNRIMLKNAVESLTTQSENLQLASEVERVTKIKYDQGVGSNLEVVTAVTELRQAQTEYYNAVYDAIVAKIELDKSLGNIK